MHYRVSLDGVSVSDDALVYISDDETVYVPAPTWTRGASSAR